MSECGIVLNNMAGRMVRYVAINIHVAGWCVGYNIMATLLGMMLERIADTKLNSKRSHHFQ